MEILYGWKHLLNYILKLIAHRKILCMAHQKKDRKINQLACSLEKGKYSSNYGSQLGGVINTQLNHR